MLAAELLVFAFDVLLPSVNDVINAFGNDHAIGEHFFGKTSDLIIAFLSVHGEVIFGVCHNYSLLARHLSARPHLRADPKYRAKGLVLPIVDITNELRGKMNNQKMTKDPMQYRGFTIEQFEEGKFGVKIGKDYVFAKSINEIKVAINGSIDRAQERDALAVMAKNKK